MNKRIVSLLTAIVLTSAVQSQITTPVLNTPKLTIPATFAGKLNLVDSLQKTKASAGVILKVFLPQYTPQFQDQLIENLRVIYATKKANGSYNYNFQDLILAVKTEYPNITRANMYRIFFALYNRINLSQQFDLWPWLTEWILNESYGDSFQEHTGPKYLKEANVSPAVIFSYYAPQANVLTESICLYTYSNKNPGALIDVQVRNTIYKFLKGGFTPQQLYDLIKNAGYRNKMWIQNFCGANALFGTPVEIVARILKSDYIDNDELSKILSSISEYNKPENLLKALQAN
jgi:hypothetical protein